MKRNHFKGIFTKVLSFALAAAAALSCAAPASALELSATSSINLIATTSSVSSILPNGMYVIYTLNQNTCVNVQYAKSVGASIVTDQITGEAENNEIWIVSSYLGYITLRPRHASNCYLSAQNGFNKGLTLSGILTDACLWKPIKNADGSITLQCKSNGYVMDTTCGRINQIGTTILAYQSNGYAEAQHYWFSRISEVSDLTPATRVNASTLNNKLAAITIAGTNKCLNIQYALTSAGAKCVLDTLNFQANEQFYIYARNNNTVSLHVSNATGMVLSCAAGNVSSGQQLVLSPYDGSDNCLWEVYQYPDGSYALRNYKTKLFVDLNNNSRVDGTAIQGYSYNGTAAQRVTFQEVTPSTPSPALTTEAAKILTRLNAMANGSYGNGVYKAGTTYRGMYYYEQCKGFAKAVYQTLFGYNIGSTKASPNNYQISINSSLTSCVGSLTSLSSKSDATVQNLFANARPGDFIQLRRSHGGSHSMIFLSSNASGVTVFECNVDGKNGIQTKTYSWSAFRSANTAVSIYTAKNYYLH